MRVCMEIVSTILMTLFSVMCCVVLVVVLAIIAGIIPEIQGYLARRNEKPAGLTDQAEFDVWRDNLKAKHQKELDKINSDPWSF